VLMLQAVDKTLIAVAGFFLGRGVGICADQKSNGEGWGWAPHLAPVTGIAVLAAAVAANLYRFGGAAGLPLFYLALAVIVTPIAARLSWPNVARKERIALVILLIEAMFLLHLIREPLGFIDHDEFLHWRTTKDILDSGKLFNDNPLLSISPFYPGLEIVTAMLAGLTGSSVFLAAAVTILVARNLFIGALFLIYERISGSSQLASLACVAYMGCSSFVIFNGAFSYESLALALLATALLAATVRADTAPGSDIIVLLMPLLAALAVTHHMTANVGGFLLAGVAILEVLRRAPRQRVARATVIAALGLGLTWGWGQHIGGVDQAYLGAILSDVMDGIREMLLSGSGDRQLFVANDGTSTPLWQQATTLIAVLMTCLGLAAGFFPTLCQAGIPLSLSSFPQRLSRLFNWRESWLVLLTFATLGYPMSILLRSTGSGWEVGNRMGAFVYLGVGVVVAVSALRWQQGRPRRWRAVLLGAAAAICVVAGVISSTGPLVLIGSFRVAADAASVEPLGIATSRWAATWLGPGNRFISDRINRLLLTTYGDQDVADPEHSAPLLAPSIDDYGLHLLRNASIDYVLVDLRLTTQLPLFGIYVDAGLVTDTRRDEPIPPATLFKFARLDGVHRIYDNGYISTYEVRSLRDAN
jgi:hypothetical protein